MRDLDQRVPIHTLVKASRKEHALDELGTVRISKPVRFRNEGESLIMDPSETLVSRTVEQTVPIVSAEVEQTRLFNEELQQCADAIGARGSATLSIPTKKIQKSTVNLALGKNGWIFSTSIESDDEGNSSRWRSSLPSNYDHIQRIPLPRAFARALGLMVAEQLGPRGQEINLKSTFGGEDFNSRHKDQTIVHGPVIYTANAFDLAAQAASKGERTFLPFFVKDLEYVDQREYRFAIWSEDEPDEIIVDLTVSQAMLSSLEDLPEHVDPADHQSVDHPAFTAPRAPSSSTQFRESPSNHDADSLPLNDRSKNLPFMSNPAAVRLSVRNPTPNEVDITSSEPTSFNAALDTLYRKLDDVTGERRQKMAAAAWYAIPWIRSLCSHYEHPIKAIWISNEDILVLDLRLPEEIAVEAMVGLGPSGARLFKIEHAGAQTISHSTTAGDRFGPDFLLESLEQFRSTHAP